MEEIHRGSILRTSESGEVEEKNKKKQKGDDAGLD